MGVIVCFFSVRRVCACTFWLGLDATTKAGCLDVDVEDASMSLESLFGCSSCVVLMYITKERMDRYVL